MNNNPSAKESLERSIRVSDQSCTAYAILRDRYKLWSTLLDLSILLTSAWLSAMVFVQPAIADRLNPTSFSDDIWLGLLSIAVFSLSLVQLQVNWKGRAQTYHQACCALAGYVKEFRSYGATTNESTVELALTRYRAITETLEPIPDAQFLTLKQHHKIKVELSKHLDSHPAANLWLCRLKIMIRDNWKNKGP